MTGMIRNTAQREGFGFINELAGRDYFFHRTALADEGFEDLRSGDRVEFEISRSSLQPIA
jgi:cold shock CspA family protein